MMKFTTKAKNNNKTKYPRLSNLFLIHFALGPIAIKNRNITTIGKITVL